jgi:hypothetical protein
VARRRHRRARAQDAQHHAERLAQLEKHHNAVLNLAARHQEQLLGQVSVAVADAQARAGAGSNPAEAGLPADQRVVPPAATKRRRA